MSTIGVLILFVAGVLTGGFVTVANPRIAAILSAIYTKLRRKT